MKHLITKEKQLPHFNDLFVETELDDILGRDFLATNNLPNKNETTFTIIPGVSYIVKDGRYFFDIQVKEQVVIRLDLESAKLFIKDLENKVKFVEKQIKDN